MQHNFDVLKKRLNINGALIYCGSLAWVFWIVYQTGDKERLIYVMNAFLFGNIVSLMVIYYKYLWYVLVSPDNWNRARQFALSSCVVWVGVFTMVAGSIYRHSTPGYSVTSTNILDLIARYFCIIAATMQIFSPSYGQPLFATIERRLLIWGSVIGLTVAIVVTVMQSKNLLDW